MRQLRRAKGILILASIAAVALAGGCRKAPPAAQLPAPTVLVMQPAKHKVQSFVEFTGKVAAIDSVQIRPRVAGFIDKVYFKDGDVVKAGASLFLIDPRNYQAALDNAKAGLAAAIAARNYSERDLQRVKEAVEKQVATSLELDLAVSRLQEGDAAVDKARAALQDAQNNLDYTNVIAPVTGRLSRTAFSVGNLVSSDAVLTTLVSVAPIYVYFNMDEMQALYIRQWIVESGLGTAHVDKLNIPAFIAVGDESGFSHRGIIDFVDNQIDPATGTLNVRAIYPNMQYELVPGAYARVRLPSGPVHDALLIPQRAIGHDQDRRYVFVVDAQGVAQYRPVTLGSAFGELQAVEKGLAPDDWVVVEGLLRTRPGEKVTAQRQPALTLPENLPGSIPMTDIVALAGSPSTQHAAAPTTAKAAPATVPASRPAAAAPAK